MTHRSTPNTCVLVLIPGVLVNQTVLEGSPLKLSCRVDSVEMFPVKWLKKVDMSRIAMAESQLSYLHIEGERYQVPYHHKQ